MLDLNDTTVGCDGHMAVCLQDLWRKKTTSEYLIFYRLHSNYGIKSNHYLSIFVPLQCWGRKGLSSTLQGQCVVDLNLNLFGGQSLPRDIILIDLRGDWSQETCF